MPIVRKLTAEEVEALECKTSKSDNARNEIARQYDQFLIEFGPNEHGEVQLEEGENKLNIRNRLRAAAERRGLKLEFIRSNGIVVRCMLSGQSPDGTWAYVTCPAPTNAVWAKVGDLGLAAAQRDALMDTPAISRIVPTVPAFAPPSAPQETGQSLAFCADRDSIWGKTHQCAATQAAADALADGEMGRINATAEAIHNKR